MTPSPPIQAWAIKAPDDDRGAPCGFCWEMLFAYSPSCQTCRLRPFGSAPCLDDMPDQQGCPGWDCCPNGSICCEVLEHEWPLAEVAINFAEGVRVQITEIPEVPHD